MNNTKSYTTLNRIAVMVMAAAICQLTGPAGAQDGTLDTSFSTDGKAYVAFDIPGSTLFDIANDMVIQPDGKIVLVGAASRNATDHDYSAVARLNVNGGLDTGFDGDGKIEFYFGDENQEFSAVALQGTKIIAAGWRHFIDSASDANYDFHVARFNANGSLDGAFGTSGTVTIAFDDISPGKWDFLEDIAIQSDGKIVLVGRTLSAAGDYDVAVARLTADGVLDTTFDADGRRVFWYDVGGGDNDQGEAVAIQPDGKIVVASTVDIATGNTDMAVNRLNTDGSTDCTFGGTCAGVLIPFNAGSPTNMVDFVFDVAIMGRKIVVAGAVDSPSGDRDMGFARLNADGSLDTTFGESSSGKRRLPFNNGGSNYDSANAIALRGDGSIVAAGIAWNASEADMAFARLALDGSVDFGFGTCGQTVVAFNFGGDLVDAALGMGIQRDGKIVAAGRASAESSATDADMAVVRLHQEHVLFADGFETSDPEIWTSSTQ